MNCNLKMIEVKFKFSDAVVVHFFGAFFLIDPSSGPSRTGVGIGTGWWGRAGIHSLILKRITDTSENITFPGTTYVVGNDVYSNIIEC